MTTPEPAAGAKPAATAEAPAHYVYLYRSGPGGKAKYIGYGDSAERASSHPGHSHNAELKKWLATATYDLTVAGPYRDAEEGKKVEAALVSAMRPEFNKEPGTGPKFVPLGVPPELSDRPAKEPVSLTDIGKHTGGALLVYLSPGDFLSDGRRKFDPADPDDETIRKDMEGVWDLGRHRDEWLDRPSEAPKVLLGIHGKNSKLRFVAGAAAIDSSRWFERDLWAKKANQERWKVPLVEHGDLDACELRGRRVTDVKFGRLSSLLHIWVDGAGVVRHPSSKAETPKGRR